MKTKIISFLLLAGLIAPIQVMSMTLNESPSTEAEILFFDDLSTMWVFVYSEDSFNKISSRSQQKLMSKKDRMLAINIFGIRKVERQESFSQTEKQQVALHEIEKRVKGRSASLNCIGVNKKTGSPVCEVIVGSVNLGLGMIENGISPFTQEGNIDSKIRKIYIDAQNYAKDEQIGVWEPFYGLFRFEDLEEMEKQRKE